MNPSIVFLCIVAVFASVNCSPIGQVREERGVLGMLGSVAGAANSLLVSKEQNRASCEYYGYIDPEFRKGSSAADNGLLIGGANVAIGALVPEETKIAGCIQQGWYHPDRPQVAAPPPQYIVVQNPPVYYAQGGK